MRTLQRRQLQPQDLRLEQSLEGSLGQEETLPEAVGIADGRADVGVGEELKRVHPVDGLDEDLAEDVLDPGSSDDGLPRLAVLAFDHLHEVLDVL